MHWILHVLGVDNVSGPWYGWWSGAGSDVGELALIGAVVAVWRTHTCHTHWWCWRRPLFSLPGSPYHTCHRHHPLDQMTPKQALKAASGGE